MVHSDTGLDDEIMHIKVEINYTVKSVVLVYFVKGFSRVHFC